MKWVYNYLDLSDLKIGITLDSFNFDGYLPLCTEVFNICASGLLIKCFAHLRLAYLIDTLNLELIKISEWLKANKLSLNVKKTKCITFTPRQKRLNCSFQIAIDNQPINQVTETTFLGVI